MSCLEDALKLLEEAGVEDARARFGDLIQRKCDAGQTPQSIVDDIANDEDGEGDGEGGGDRPRDRG